MRLQLLDNTIHRARSSGSSPTRVAITCVVPYLLYTNSTFNLAKSLKIFLRCAVTFRKLKKPQLIFGGCVYQQIRWYNVIAVVFVLQMRTLRAEKSICLSQAHVVSGRAEPRTQSSPFLAVFFHHTVAHWQVIHLKRPLYSSGNKVAKVCHVY